jgi:hypothetical protein
MDEFFESSSETSWLWSAIIAAIVGKKYRIANDKSPMFSKAKGIRDIYVRDEDPEA